MLQNVTVTAEDYHFTPVAKDVDATQIEKFRILLGQVPKLGSDICHTFNNLEELNLYRLELAEIEEEAFKDCKRLRVIVLTGNKLRELHPRLFIHNHNLEDIYLTDNQLDERSLQSLSGATSLRQIYLGENKFKTLAPDSSLHLPNLSVLVVYSNQISDVDVEKLLNFAPELFGLAINDNDLKCGRLQKIREETSEKGVDMSKMYNHDKPKERNSTVQLDEEKFICIPD